MIAFKATIEVNGSNPEVILVGAVNLASAARKAAESIAEQPKKELIKIEKTEDFIL